MNITKILYEVYVIPEYQGLQNVIRRVRWALQFEQNGVTSLAGAETFLNVDQITNFLPANEVGNDRVLQWAFEAQGGDAFVAQIQPYHEEQLAYAAACAGQELFTDGFQSAIQAMTGPTPSIPSSVV